MAADPGGSWSAVAIAADVPEGSVHPAELGDMALAVWRDEAGAAHVWEDRCPHRGMRLSFGFVRGTRLTCLYHGWEYGADAACRRIPAHPDMAPPDTICATAYPVAERYGMILTAPARLAAPAQPGGNWHGVRSLFAACPADEALRIAAAPGALAADGLAADGPVHRGDEDGAGLALAVHPGPAGDCALHLTTTAGDPAIRLDLARRLVALRPDLDRAGRS